MERLHGPTGRIPPHVSADPRERPDSGVFLRPVNGFADGRAMKCTLVGSRYFGALVFDALVKDGVDVAQVVAPAADDRLALAAAARGVPVHVLENPKTVP